jgi:hypothetical protein
MTDSDTNWMYACELSKHLLEHLSPFAAIGSLGVDVIIGFDRAQ